MAFRAKHRYIVDMLSLLTTTSERWFEQVRNHLDELIVDHAHCEKAAGVAMNLIFAYVDQVPLCRALTEIVREELEHFELVLSLCERRGIAFRKLPPSRYGPELHRLIRKEEPGRAVDRFLIAGLIEARSCERFALLRDRLADVELAAFYGGLFESEARHHSTYVRFAKEFADEETVRRRLSQLAAEEARIVAEGDPNPRMHS